MELKTQVFCTLKLNSKGWNKDKGTRAAHAPISHSTPKETRGSKVKQKKLLSSRPGCGYTETQGCPPAAHPAGAAYMPSLLGTY